MGAWNADGGREQAALHSMHVTACSHKTQMGMQNASKSWHEDQYWHAAMQPGFCDMLPGQQPARAAHKQLTAPTFAYV